MREELLALLEEGAQSTRKLGRWLQIPTPLVLTALTALSHEGRAHRVGPQMWDLTPTIDAAPPSPPVRPDEDFEVVWAPHRDAPSLTQPFASGSSLSGEHRLGRASR